MRREVVEPRAAVPRGARRAVPRPLARPGRDDPRRRRLRRPPALRLRPARRRGRSATRRRTPACCSVGLRSRLGILRPRAAPPAPGRHPPATTSTPTSAFASSRRSCSQRCGSRPSRPQAPRPAQVHRRRALAARPAAVHAPPPPAVRRPQRDARGRSGCSRRGSLWRHALEVRSRGVERPAGWTYDAKLPQIGEPPVSSDPETAHIESIVSPLDLALSEREPERINLLIPTIDLRHLFGGYIAKFNLARRLAESGRRVRIVAVDRTPPLPADWREQVEAYSGLEGALANVEVAFARDEDAAPRQPERPLHRDDLVDRPRRAGGDRRGRPRALPLPDPGVRAVHLRDGEPRGARVGELRVRPRRPVLDRAPARVLRPPRLRGLRGGRGRRPRRLRLLPQRDHAGRAAERRRARGAGDAARSSSTPAPSRTPAATCTSSGSSRSPGRSRRAPSGRSGSSSGSARSAGTAASPSPAAPSSRSSTARASPTTASCSGRHDVGLALMYTPHPSLVPAGDGLRGPGDGDQQLRRQDARGHGGDLI